MASCAELTYVTAPLVIPGGGDAGGEEGGEDGGRGWWFSKSSSSSSSSSFDAHEYSDCDAGFDGSVSAVADAFREQGPFDGVLAFSQVL